jgi:AMP deaminase
VTESPESDPSLHHFLKRVAGFDTVDDESKRERRIYKHIPRPAEWTSENNPPYSYYLYYIYANIASLNQFRSKRGFSTLSVIIIIH